MSCSEFIMWFTPDGTYWEAPYDNGAGGKFTTADPERVEWLGLLLAEGGIDLASDSYIHFDSDVDSVKPLERLTGKKRFSKHKFEISVAGNWQEFACPGLDESSQNALSTDSEVLLAKAPDTEDSLVWLNDGGRQKWLDDRAAKKAAEQEREQRSQLKRMHDDGNHFINPYTFVPLPERISRAKPRRHDAMDDDAVSGWFTWRLTFETPLVYPHLVDPKDRLPTTANGLISYPGSALRGALRNLHESLTGGCMRVLDDEYVPVHREPMTAGNQKHTLAVVREVDPFTDAVTEVELTENLHWVDVSVVHAHIPNEQLYSGRRVHLDENHIVATEGPNKRNEIREGEPFGEGDDWVVHLSDAAARGENYFVAVAKLNGKREPISSKSWQEFKKLCAGARDLIGETDPPNMSSARPEKPGWPSKEVKHKGELIGYRRKVDGHLSEGDTVWLTGAPGNRHLKMATIWRHLGEHPVRDRMNQDFLPCHDPDNLCPTCAVFGSVDARPADTDGRGTAVEQAGYASHVRVGWARSTLKPTTREVDDIAPLRGPKPSSGGFYLTRNASNPGKASKAENHIPHAHWGSGSDQPVRRIRGRKFYWHGQISNHGQTSDSVNRQTRRDDQVQDEPVTVADAGLVLEARVSFDNLSREQLGWLLAAADPAAFLGSECWVHIGRGKPLGYGSAQPKVVGLHMYTAQSRYGSAMDKSADQNELISAVRQQVPAELHAVHDALRRVLASKPQDVPADRIWYPTTGNFTSRDANSPGRKSFDESFKWFAEHSGGRPTKDASGDLVSLPEITDDIQFISNKAPIDDKTSRPQPNNKTRKQR